MKLPEELKEYREDWLGATSRMPMTEAIVRDCANIAMAIDSGRGNEKEIYKGILARYGLKQK